MSDNRAAAIDRLLTRRVVDVVDRDALRALLDGDRPLRVKLGLDPSAPDLHIGHAVVLDLLRDFQELGHTAVLIVGDTTAQIGDPSGRNVTRPMLTAEQVRANAETYLAQFYRVVDQQRSEVRWQSEWFGRFALRDVMELTSRFTLARMIERDTFAKRLADGAPIAMHETLYPLLQAYDSVAARADVELGGTDQTFNLLVGRDIQRDYGQPPQQIMTTELLVGTDGVQKMSKSLDNAIGLTDPPYEQYARTMSISDAAMPSWLRLATRVEPDEVSALIRGVESGEVHAKAAKQRLAREIVTRWHGADAAREAEAEWERRVVRGEPAADTEVVVLRAPPGGLDVPDIIVGSGSAQSRSEARRLVRQGGVRIDGSVVPAEDRAVPPGAEFELRVGKRRAARIRIEAAS
ncbi:MAG: tyrosine--tRNA ligase [Chloroflexota bacterium]|nr:tyrosine--tRNA ligase [Chloroflexota bacterium]